ncbi:MAG TPA: alpha-hydroxy-acid oxidizing protein [Mycobacterium sp.]|nr:alpha-hydroxy-acid oxidizing protein [Mycobacterium sp.]
MTSLDQSISGRRWRELLSRQGRQWPVAIEEWERCARDALDARARGYVFGGAGSGGTRDANVSAFARWRLAPHVMATPVTRELSVTLLGQTYPTPIFLAPVGVLTIAHPDGDLAAAAAARDLGMTYVVSTAGSEPMESVMADTPGLSAWYQLYWINNRDLTASFVDRAKSAGYSALVVTVDTPMLGWRERDLTNAYSPFSYGHGIGQFVSDPIFRSLLDFDIEQNPGRAGQEMMKLFVNPGLGWNDLAWLRDLTDLPIFLKGVLRADDARRAVDTGVDGLIVSNHGGRQVDGSIAALDALTVIRPVVDASVPVLLDGGVRRGPDVVKAIALGADAVLVGRPYVYGLSVGGRAGVYEVLANLLAETDSVLALSGYRSLAELDRDALADPECVRP